MNNSSFSVLDNSGILSVTGRDAVKFLQGYVTNDLDTLTPGIWQPGAFCNLKGRVIANFRMINRDGVLLMRMNRELVQVVHNFLHKYIVFSKAQTRDASDDFCLVGLSGDAAEECVKQLLPDPLAAGKSWTGFAAHLALSLQGTPNAFELWLESETATAVCDSLGEQLTQTRPESWELHEIQSGWAWITPLTTEQYIPQMVNLQAQDGISFNKGCYLGQEIVARMQYLGQLKRRMHRYRGCTEKPPQPGDKLFSSENKALGEIVASVTTGNEAAANEYEILAVVRESDPESAPLPLQLGDNEALEILPLPYICAS